MKPAASKSCTGSHRQGQLHHSVRQGRARNMLPRGQSVSTEFDARATGRWEMPVKPGNSHCTTRLPFTVRSPTVRTDRRIGVGDQPIPARVRFTGQSRLSAKLVRGVDRYHHFDPRAEPAGGLRRRQSRAAHERITRASTSRPSRNWPRALCGEERARGRRTKHRGACGLRCGR